MRRFLLGLLLSFFAVTVTANTHDNLVRACTATVHDYAVFRDALDAEHYAGVFLADGVFATPGPTHKGKAALLQYIENQPANRRTMHHITTLKITPTGDSTATGIVYVTVHFSDQPASGPAVLDRIANAIYRDEYQLIDGACKIKHRQLEIKMDTKLPE